jgi:hypothetical protein
MLIHGTRYTPLAEGQLPSPCVHCGKEGTVSLTIEKSYHHVFFIPFFPKSRTGASTCSHCKQTLGWDEMPDNYRAGMMALGSTVRNPWWHWSGLVLLIGFAGFIAYLMVGDSKREEERVHYPHVGDVWSIKNATADYTVWRLVAVDSSTVTYEPHTMSTDKIKGLKALRTEHAEAYDTERVTIPRARVLSLHEGDTLMMVVRE